MQKLLQEGSQKGQSFHHIYQANKEDMLCSERYLYTLKEQGLITVDPFTLPRTLQRKQAKKKRRAHKVDPACQKGRTYKDYTSFLHNNPGLFTVEMDTVEGVWEDSKCFLSLAWKAIQLNLCFLMQRQTTRCVQDIFLWLHHRLGPSLFLMLFPVLLTDNGSEFSNPRALEMLGTRVFYCDPRAANQKGNVENQNGQLRRIVPKGYSIQELTFEDSFLINAHLNSYIRASIQNKTAFQWFQFAFPKQAIEALRLYEVPPSDVLLSPKLLKGKLHRKKY